MTTQEVMIQKSNSLFVPTYSRFPVMIAEGYGCVLKDSENKEYLDFLAGIAVCSLGHCHPRITDAVCQQIKKLVHVSNLFHTFPQTRLADMLVANSFADRVFFANSGAEVNEAAIKLARKYGGEGRYEIISLEGSFHGRTLAAVTATGQPKFHKGFEPLPKGFRYAPFGNIAALEELISEKTCAILLEPVQGEGGVRPLPESYLKAIRTLCDKHDLLLIFDEVQVGMGRTGSLFAYQQTCVTPDVMTLAKALGNGLPIGALLTTERIAPVFSPGTHASTFGGNPIASAAAVAVMEIMLEEGFLEGVQARGRYMTEKLSELIGKYKHLLSGVRGLGLIQGLVLTEEGVGHGAEIVNKMFDRGVLINFAGNAVLRFIPPLIVTEKEIDLMIQELSSTLASI